MTENFWCPLPCLNKRISEICLRFFYRYLQYCQDSIRQNCKIKKYNDLWLSIKIELFLQNLPYCSLHLILRKYITLLSCHLLNMPSIKKKRKKNHENIFLHSNSIATFFTICFSFLWKCFYFSKYCKRHFNYRYVPEVAAFL